MTSLEEHLKERSQSIVLAARSIAQVKQELGEKVLAHAQAPQIQRIIVRPLWLIVTPSFIHHLFGHE